MNDSLMIIFLTLAPFFELRAGIPYGLFKTELSLFWIVFLAILFNILLAPIIFLFLRYLLHFFLRIGLVDRVWKRIILKKQRKLEPYVQKYGVLGLAFFIAVPLPGSGVYSGAIGATLLGYSFKEFLIASIMGVFIAAFVVTSISLFGEGVVLSLLKT